jgi:hypothetical protein
MWTVENGMAPKVSVSIITYNHRAFIAHALESALMGDNFETEILLGERFHRRHPAIVVDFAQKHPDGSGSFSTTDRT